MPADIEFCWRTEALGFARYDLLQISLLRLVDAIAATTEMVTNASETALRRQLRQLPGPPEAWEPMVPELASRLGEPASEAARARVVPFLLDVLAREVVEELHYVALMSSPLLAGSFAARWSGADRELHSCRFGRVGSVLDRAPLLYAPSPAADEVAAYRALVGGERVAAAAARLVPRRVATLLVTLERAAYGAATGRVEVWKALRASGVALFCGVVEVAARAVSAAACEKLSLARMNFFSLFLFSLLPVTLFTHRRV